MTFHAEHKKQRKLLSIVQAAEEIFFEKAYGSITVDEIAQAAGVTKRTLYTYFPSKIALFIHIFEGRLQRLHHRVLEARERESSPDKALLNAARELFQFTWENEKFMRFFWAMDSNEFDGEIPAELIHSLRIWNRGLIDSTVELVRQGQAQGRIKADVDPELFVHLVSAVNKGILIHTNKETKLDIASVRPEDLMNGFIRLTFSEILTDAAAIEELSTDGPQEASTWKNLS